MNPNLNHINLSIQTTEHFQIKVQYFNAIYDRLRGGVYGEWGTELQRGTTT